MIRNRTLQRKIIVLDQCLRGLGAHSATAAKSFLQAGENIEVWANQTHEMTQEDRVSGVFTYSDLDPPVRFPAIAQGGLFAKLSFACSLIKRIYRANRTFYKDVTSRMTSDPSIWFAVNGSLRNVFALLFLCRKYKENSAICYFLQAPARSIRFVESLRRILHVENLFFAAETQRLASQVESTTDSSCHFLPFPIPNFHKAHSSTKKSTLTAGFLGMPRREKGFDVLVKSILLLKDELVSETIKFKLHAPTHYLKIEGIDQDLQALDAIENKEKSIEMISHNLDVSDYYAFLEDCDFLVIPYRTEAYEKRSSLVPVEATLYKKPMVMTSGLLVIDSLPDIDSIIHFSDGSADDLAKAITKMVEEFTSYQQNAAKVPSEWSYKYSPKSLVDHIHKICHNSHSDL